MKRFGIIAATVALSLLPVSGASAAIKDYSTVWAAASPNAVCAANASFEAGTLPAFIPEPYNGVFTAAGAEFNVDPALIAALFTSENFTHTDPAALPGTWASFIERHPDPNAGWATSSAAASGPFQFIPPTWASLGVDGDKNGTKDVNNLADAAFGAANYAKTDKATLDTPPATWRTFVFSYNHANWYVDMTMEYYQYYKTGDANTAEAASVTNVTQAAGCGGGDALGGIDCTQEGALVSGNQKLLCAAEQFDKFGYLFGGGHQAADTWMTTFNRDGGFGAEFKHILDCSGIVNIAMYNAYGVISSGFVADDDGSGASILATVDQNGNKLFQKITMAESQPGDVLVRSGHMAIAAANGGVPSFAARSKNLPLLEQIGPSTDSSFITAVRYIGPGSTGEAVDI